MGCTGQAFDKRIVLGIWRFGTFRSVVNVGASGTSLERTADTLPVLGVEGKGSVDIVCGACGVGRGVLGRCSGACELALAPALPGWRAGGASLTVANGTYVSVRREMCRRSLGRGSRSRESQQCRRLSENRSLFLSHDGVGVNCPGHWVAPLR